MIAMLILGSLWAADTPPAQISAEQRAMFWRASSDFQMAKQQFDAAQARLNAAMDDMRKTCGENRIFGADLKGEPACLEKPAPAVRK